MPFLVKVLLCIAFLFFAFTRLSFGEHGEADILLEYFFVRAKSACECGQFCEGRSGLVALSAASLTYIAPMPRYPKSQTHGLAYEPTFVHLKQLFISYWRCKVSLFRVFHRAVVTH